MTGDVAIVLAIVTSYLLLTIVIGWYSSRFSQKTMEDYHMAGREFGSIVLFSTVFGANISAVTFIGLPGMAYHVGWVAWPYFVTSWAWLTPLLLFVLARRAAPLGRRLGYMTIGEIVGGRWGSPVVSLLVSVTLLVYTIPYLMTGLRGAGVTVEVVTNGYLSFATGAAIVAVVVVLYLTLGGMRGAAWVNTLQTGVFLAGAIVIFFVVAAVLGGPARATQDVMANHPELLARTRMPWQQFFSYGVIVALAVPLFPQVFMRLLMGKDARSLRQIVRIYPVPALLVFFLMAHIGMWGRAVIPGLQGAESDSILPRLLLAHTSIWMMGILAAAIFAAMMSTMDSQLMSATTIITRDFLSRSRFGRTSDATRVLVSKLLVVLLTAAAYALAMTNPSGIIQIVEFAFAGFACLMPVTVAALYWRRCTAGAAIASLIAPQIVLAGLTFGWFDRSLSFGFLPGLPALVAAVVTLVAVTYLTRPSRDDAAATYFAPVQAVGPVVAGTTPLARNRAD
jgi:SSS family solute:Na+ symporter